MTASLPRRLLAVAAFAAVAVVAVQASAFEITDPQSWFASKTPPPIDKRVPLCDDAGVRKEVTARIADAIPAYYDGLEVRAIDHVEQSQVTVDDPSTLARRYCTARLALSAEPKQPPIEQFAYYMVEERAGFVGVSWSVEVCLPGRDKWRVYDGACRTVRPAPAQ